MTEPHRCIAGTHCRAGKPGEPALTIDNGVLCDACRTNFANCIRRLPHDYDMLTAALGERQTTTGDFVRSSPTPAIPISTGAEAVMAEIADILDTAAQMVAAQLDIDTPTARRNTAPKARSLATGGKVKLIDPAQHTVAWNAEQHVRPSTIETIRAHVRLVEPHVDTLAAAPLDYALVWVKPQRCDEHYNLISTAEELVAANVDGADSALAVARHQAADCDTCNGWDQDGQARELVELSGLDVLHRIRNTHHRARAHLGHTRLRHHYDMPCPAYTRTGDYCGALTVGRDDGSDWVDCTTCGTRWTEREYDWLKTLIAGDKEIDMLRYLLAEAYWRLDQLEHGVQVAKADPAIDAPGAGRAILEGIERILNAGYGHQTPDKRKTST